MLVLKNGDWLSVFHVSSIGESMKDQHTVCRLSKGIIYIKNNIFNR